MSQRVRRVAVTGVSGDAGRGIVRGLRSSRRALWILGLEASEFAAQPDLCDETRSMPLVGDSSYLDIFLARFASEDEKPPSWVEIGARHHLGQKEARHRAETVQRRFRAALREVLIEEQGSPEAADEEIATLLAILGNSR